MKQTRRWANAIMLLSLTSAIPSHASTITGIEGLPNLTINGVVESGTTNEYIHPEEVVLSPGFWARAGSDVTIRTALTLLQLSPYPHVSPPPPASDDRSASPPPDCLEGGYHPCISGYAYEHHSDRIEIGYSTSLPNPIEYYAITTINVIEADANPCKLMLWGTMLDPRFSNGKERLLAIFELATCKPTIGALGPAAMSVVQFEQPNRFLRTLRICTDTQLHSGDVVPLKGPAGRNEIKGLEIRPGQVSSGNEHVTPLDATIEDKRPNCPNRDAFLGPGVGRTEGWHVWSTCPDGQLAAGIEVYREKRSFSGMRVICKYVRLLPGAAPKVDERGIY